MATQVDDGKAWADGLHGRIAATIRNARTRAGMSAQDVADQTQQLGYGLSRDKIANYESGRKQGLDVTELLVIAAALRLPPVSLIFGGPPDEPVQALPGNYATMADGLAWLSGDPSIAENAVAEPDSYHAAMLRLIRERAVALRDLDLARRVIADFERRGIAEEHRAAHLATTGKLMEFVDGIDNQIQALIEGDKE